jgi:hypothetical protein
MAETRRFAGLVTRSEINAANNLGIVSSSLATKNVYRKKSLDCLDAYYEMRQYAGKAPWEQASTKDSEYIPIRDRQPRLQYGFARVLASRLASKLVGSRTFPRLQIEDDPDTEDFFRLIKRQSLAQAKLLEPIRRTLIAGSCFVRFSIISGQYKLEYYLSKWCYPVFDAAGNLESVEIKYIFSDEEDLDEKKQPKRKWYKLELSKNTDTLFDNPEVQQDGGVPEFKVVSTANHNFGFVQGEWFKTSDVPNSVDGDSLIEPILGFIDELNYSLSQSSRAVEYNQDPQLAMKNIDEEEMDTLIRSSSKAWNLGKEGEAEFLEAGMAGVEAANTLRDKVKLSVQDLTRIILLDPEKMMGHAQSGEAMKVLMGPMIELIEELRPMIEKSITSLFLKMGLATLLFDKQGGLVPIEIPAGYVPGSLNITLQWPEIFPPTLEDIQKKVSIASSVTNANILSRETMTKWLSKEFGVEDIEEELAKIAAQPVINPFGGF